MNLKAPQAPQPPFKALGPLLEQLIKSAKQPTAQRHIAQRIFQLWSAHPAARITLEFDRLLYHDEIILEMNEQQGLWLLPLFIAGVREIGLHPWVTVSDISALGQLISTLKISSQDLESLLDWLWAGGAHGLDIEVNPSSLDLIELMGAEPEQYLGFGKAGQITNAAATGLQTTALRMDRQALMTAALQPEFKTTVDLLQQGLAYRGFEASPQERERLSKQLQDEDAWRLKELGFILETPALRETLGAQAIVEQLIARPNAPQLIEALLDAASGEDGFSHSLRVQLQKQGFGPALAAALTLDEPAQDATRLCRLLGLLPLDQTHATLLGLLERAQLSKRFEQLFGLLIARLGLPKLKQLLDESALTPAQGQRWAQTLIQVKTPPAHMIDTFSKLDDEAIVQLTPRLPQLYLLDLEQRLIQILEHGERRFVEELIVYAIERKLAGFVRIAAMIMREQRGLTWSRRTTLLVCKAIQEASMGEEFLVHYVRERHVAQSVREAALEVLEQQSPDQLLQQATKWRLSELFDPTDFRERLKSDRKRRLVTPCQ